MVWYRSALFASNGEGQSNWHVVYLVLAAGVVLGQLVTRWKLAFKFLESASRETKK